MLTIKLEHTNVKEGVRVLDIGCGGGRHTYDCLRRGADVVAIDAKFDEVVGVAQMTVALRRDEGIAANGVALAGDAFALPMEDDSFDCVIASEVLEHLVDDDAAIRELVRVLRPMGSFAMSVPRRWPERINWWLSKDYHNKPGGHVRIYRRSALTAILEQSGLRVVAVHHAHGLHSPYWWLRCAVGVDRESLWCVRLYHRFLVWDIMKKPALTRALDTFLNPLMGKSLVVYCEKVML